MASYSQYYNQNYGGQRPYSGTPYSGGGAGLNTNLLPAGHPFATDAAAGSPPLTGQPIGAPPLMSRVPKMGKATAGQRNPTVPVRYVPGLPPGPGNPNFQYPEETPRPPMVPGLPPQMLELYRNRQPGGPVLPSPSDGKPQIKRGGAQQSLAQQLAMLQKLGKRFPQFQNLLSDPSVLDAQYFNTAGGLYF